MSSLTTSCVMEPNKTGEEEDRGNSDCVRNMGQCLDNEIITQIIKIRLSNDIYIYLHIFYKIGIFISLSSKLFIYYPAKSYRTL